jgi:hypothetical protein
VRPVAGVTAPYVLYLGRVDPNKGCETLLRYFQEFVDREGPRVQLVLAGPVFMPVPSHPAIVSLGFVDEATRSQLLDSALALIVPSQYESLCIALLEGWNHSLPALVNGRCSVLKGQVLRANGGLFYGNATEFVTALRELIDQPDMARQIGRQGLQYVDGVFYEGTGLNGRSSIRKVRIDTGEVLQKRDLESQYFGEGITVWNAEIVQLTYQSGKAFVYDTLTFAPRRSFTYQGEGWGLTHDRDSLIMSDGSDALRFLDPATFAGASVFLLAVALIASIAPALRATRIQPIAALHAE